MILFLLNINFPTRWYYGFGKWDYRCPSLVSWFLCRSAMCRDGQSTYLSLSLLISDVHSKIIHIRVWNNTIFILLMWKRSGLRHLKSILVPAGHCFDWRTSGNCTRWSWKFWSWYWVKCCWCVTYFSSFREWCGKFLHNISYTLSIFRCLCFMLLVSY